MKSTRCSILLKSFLLLTVAALLTGLTWVNGKITWQFLVPWGSSNFDNSGIPLPKSPYFFKDPTYNQPQFINYITATLPEGVDQSENVALLRPPRAKNIYLKESLITNPQTALELSFVYEGSTHRNSLGYFLFDADNRPTGKTDNARILYEGIVFPNTSFFNSGGSPFGLRNGDSVYLDLTPAMGKTSKGVIGIGFFLVTGGFSATEGVNSSALADWIFHTMPVMNTELGASPANAIPYNEHTALVQYPGPGPGAGLIALGIEESNRTPGMGSDNDFNDVVYSITVNPLTAIANGDYGEPIYSAPVTDADGDGVADSLDEFPNDPERASSSWYPSKTGWNTLAYEDLWPARGDYDMNDLVLNYRYREILKADGTVKEIEVIYRLLATGAQNHNGFALELTGIPAATALNSSTLQINGGTAVSLSPATSVMGRSRTHLVFNLFDSARTAFGESLVNTVKGRAAKSPITYKLNVAFATPRPKAAFTYAPPYNPFLFRTSGTDFIEVHLPGYAPTAAASASLFGTVDDNTSLAARRYYVSTLGHPWALNIAADWKWPVEGTDILTAYPAFKSWAESGGATSSTWYLTPTTGTTY